MQVSLEKKQKIVQNTSRSRTYHSSKNLLLGLMNKMITIILAFVSRNIFIRVLSVEYLGINGLFADVLTMLSLADLGFGTAMAYSFYKPIAENDEIKITALITFYRKIYNYIAGSVLVIGLAIVPFLNQIVNVEHEINHLELYYLICLGNTVLSYLFVYKSSIITASQKNYIITQYSVWISCARVLLQTVILVLTRNYVCYLSITLVATLANNLLISYKANQMYPYIRNKIELDKKSKKEIFDNMKSVFLYKLSSVIMTGSDNIIISKLVGTVYVGFYSNYHTITVNQLGSLAAILFGSLTPSIGNLIVKEDAKKRYLIFQSMQMVALWLSGLFVVCLFFLTDDFITLWLGPEHVMEWNVLVAVLMNFYLLISFYPIWCFREATGLYQKIKYILVFTAVLNIILSILLGYVWQVGGIIIATVIAKLCTYVWYEPIILFRDFFERSTRPFFLSHLTNIGMILGCMILIFKLIPNYDTVTVTGWVIRGIICFSITNVVYLLRYWKTNEFQEVMHKLKSMRHKC